MVVQDQQEGGEAREEERVGGDRASGQAGGSRAHDNLQQFVRSQQLVNSQHPVRSHQARGSPQHGRPRASSAPLPFRPVTAPLLPPQSQSVPSSISRNSKFGIWLDSTRTAPTMAEVSRSEIIARDLCDGTTGNPFADPSEDPFADPPNHSTDQLLENAGDSTARLLPEVPGKSGMRQRISDRFNRHVLRRKEHGVRFKVDKSLKRDTADQGNKKGGKSDKSKTHHFWDWFVQATMPQNGTMSDRGMWQPPPHAPERDPDHYLGPRIGERNLPAIPVELRKSITDPRSRQSSTQTPQRTPSTPYIPRFLTRASASEPAQDVETTPSLANTVRTPSLSFRGLRQRLSRSASSAAQNALATPTRPAAPAESTVGRLENGSRFVESVSLEGNSSSRDGNDDGEQEQTRTQRAGRRKWDFENYWRRKFGRR